MVKVDVVEMGTRLVKSVKEQKLVVVIMGQNCQKFIGMCLESVKDADSIVYLCGTSPGLRDKSADMAQEFLIKNPKIKPAAVIKNPYDQEDNNMNGKQRNFYLDYIKENYPDHWCLVLDADEVCEDINKVKEFIQTATPALYYPKMRHFIGDLGHEDFTRPEHFVPNRLFKIDCADSYPIDSHPVLQSKTGETGQTDCTTIWHLGHLPVEYMQYISKRYAEHVDNSNMHTPQFLTAWRDAHLYGKYPIKEINPTEIPKVILDNFNIDFDELYFKPRKQMEIKHYQDAIDWKDFFNPEKALLFGCGYGQRVYTLSKLGVESVGIDVNQYIVDLTPHSVVQGDITTPQVFENTYDLITAYDILEHLKYEDLDKAIDSLMKTKKYILVSIQFKEIPICEADQTHIIKENQD